MSKKNNASIQMIADYEGDISNLFNVNVEGEVPVLATRNMVTVSYTHLTLPTICSV